MKIIKRAKLEHVVTCTKCHTELQYDKYDLRWSHTDQDYYYVVCPVCGEIIWIPADKELDKMFNEELDEREKEA